MPFKREAYRIGPTFWGVMLPGEKSAKELIHKIEKYDSDKIHTISLEIFPYHIIIKIIGTYQVIEDDWRCTMSIGLVLEGGGTRGWYTGGVLTVLHEEGIHFSTVYGVSAGAMNALAYISGQINQNTATAYMKNMTDERYMGIRNLHKTGSFFNFDFMLKEQPHTIPFDYDTFFNSPVRLEVGTTDIETGQSVYFSKKEMDDDFTPVRASCSLPLIANIVKYKGHLLLDGGCSEPIPIERSIKDGNKKNIIVLTQDVSYHEKPGHGLSYLMLCIKYRRYPNFMRLMKNHSEIYNSEANLCMELEKEGKAIVIRPSIPVELRRYNDTEMLFKIYRMGMDDCRKKLPQIKQFTA